MAQFTPNAGRNRETTGGRRQSRDKTLAAVIHFYLEAARRGKNNFVTAPMGVTAADFALGNISNPENTLNILETFAVLKLLRSNSVSDVQ